MAEQPNTTEAHAILECSSLSKAECADLETFLEAQPEIKRVWRVMLFTESAPDPDAISSIAPHVDLAIGFVRDALTPVAKDVMKVALGVLIEKLLNKKWNESRKPEERKFVAILGPDGQTVMMVPRDSPPHSK